VSSRQLGRLFVPNVKVEMEAQNSISPLSRHDLLKFESFTFTFTFPFTFTVTFTFTFIFTSYVKS
jgi:hypothetical protein